MVESGGCTYETKARNIENAGAQGAIIIEPYEDEDVRFTEDSLKDFYDGSGHSITIPTLIIEADDAEKLRKVMLEKDEFDNSVVLKADIEISVNNVQTISYTLFYGSILDLDKDFIKSLYEYQHALGDKAIFIPRIFTFECPLCPQEIQDQYCLGDGLYCF